MKIPLHTKIRREFRGYLYKMLASDTKDLATYLDLKDVKSIVIVRPNYRIGNIIFLTPFINYFYELYPDIKIDVVVGSNIAGKILQKMPNVDKIIPIDRKLLANPFALYSFISKTREIKYDLAINISAGSISSEIVTSLINAKYKASFESEKTFIKLTHKVKQDNIYTHAGSKTLELFKLFDVPLPKGNLDLDIKLTDDEIAKAKEIKAEVLKNVKSSAKVVVLFRNARFDKKIADEWWNEWHSEMLKVDKDIVVVDILSPDILEKLNDNVITYSNKDLRMLGAFFSVCDLYVSADTGPLHIAIASHANVLALFNKTDPSFYGTLSSSDLTLEISDKTAKDVAMVTLERLG